MLKFCQNFESKYIKVVTRVEFSYACIYLCLIYFWWAMKASIFSDHVIVKKYILPIKYVMYSGYTRWKFEDPDVLIILVSFGPIMLPGSATKSTWFFWSGAIIAAWNIWSRYVLVVNIQIHFRNLPIFLCMLSECCFCWQLWKLPFILIDLGLFFLFIYTINFNFRRRNYCDLSLWFLEHLIKIVVLEIFEFVKNKILYRYYRYLGILAN